MDAAMRLWRLLSMRGLKFVLLHVHSNGDSLNLDASFWSYLDGKHCALRQVDHVALSDEPL